MADRISRRHLVRLLAALALAAPGTAPFTGTGAEAGSDRRCRELTRAIDAVVRELERRRKELSEAKARRSSIRHDLRVAEVRLAEAKRVLKRLRASQARLKKILKQRLKERRDARLFTSGAERRLKQAYHDYYAARRKVRAKERQIGKLEKARLKLIGQRADIERRINRIRDRIARLQRRERALRKEIRKRRCWSSSRGTGRKPRTVLPPPPDDRD